MARDERTSANDLVVAFDFGTTYTGVAYYHSGAALSPTIDENDLRRTAERINVINLWPSNPAINYAEKTPTILAYTQEPPLWGGQVRNHHRPQITRFKLGLEPNIARHYGYAELEFGTHAQLPEKLPVHFATDFLTCVHQHVKTVCFPRQFGADVMEAQRMRYIVTVPAIWTDAAKNLTRRAASQAFGIPDEKLMLISEPEAAALYCVSMCADAGLNDGDHFLVCDAGGGTVVCVIFRKRAEHRILSVIPCFGNILSRSRNAQLVRGHPAGPFSSKKDLRRYCGENWTHTLMRS